MMFVRKNKVETVPNYYNGGYGYQPYEEMPEQEAYTHHNETENEPVEEPQQRRRPSRRSMERKNKRMIQQQAQQIKSKTNKNHMMINMNSFLNVL